jgi:hypothetical protein
MVCVVVVGRVFVRKQSRLCVVFASGEIVTVGCVFVLNVCAGVARGVFMENVWRRALLHMCNIRASLNGGEKTK